MSNGSYIACGRVGERWWTVWGTVWPMDVGARGMVWGCGWVGCGRELT